MLEDDLQPVFLAQTVGHDLELQLAHGADDEVRADLGAEQLGDAFLGQAVERLLQVFGLERILDPDALEDFRGEVGQAGEADQAALRQAVADAQHAVVRDADHVAGEGVLGQFAVARRRT